MQKWTNDSERREYLDTAFQQFLAHDTSIDLLVCIRESATPDDVDALIGSVEELGDPSSYCKDDFDTETPAGYFLYIDFISGLIINMGEPAQERAAQYKNPDRPFVKWIIKFTGDTRFHDEIMAKFADVFSSGSNS